MYLEWSKIILDPCTEVRFASSLSGGFITAIVVNPPESKLAKLQLCRQNAPLWNVPKALKEKLLAKALVS